MKKVLAYILSALTLAGASVLHGGNYLTKGLIIAISCLIMAGLAWFAYGWVVAPAGIIAALIWWFMARTGANAHAELSYQDRVEGAKKDAIWKAYIGYACVCGLLICLGASQNWWLLLCLPLGLAATINTLYFAETYRQDDGESRRVNRMMVELATPGAWAAGAMLGMCELEGLVRGWVQ